MRRIEEGIDRTLNQNLGFLAQRNCTKKSAINVINMVTNDLRKNSGKEEDISNMSDEVAFSFKASTLNKKKKKLRPKIR